MKKETTFKELKKTGFIDRSINQEIQDNLITRIKSNKPVF